LGTLPLLESDFPSRPHTTGFDVQLGNMRIEAISLTSSGCFWIAIPLSTACITTLEHYFSFATFSSAIATIALLELAFQMHLKKVNS